MRTGWLDAVGKIWKLAKEQILVPGDKEEFTFLGIDLVLGTDGNLLLTQERFIKGMLEKYGLEKCSANKTVTMDKLSESDEGDIPSADQLRALQAHGGEFNWLATRTRPDISYCTSLLASACTKQAQWCFVLAGKILRYLRSSWYDGRWDCHGPCG